MPKLKNMKISNFKGIDSVDIEFSGDDSPGRFIALVGLNESGKTTILEAISKTSLADRETSDLFSTINGPPEINDFIPKKHKAAFTGAVSILANISLDDDDITSIKEYLRDTHKLEVVGQLPRKLTIDRQFEFDQSTFKSQWNYWNFTARVRKQKGTVVRNLNSRDDLRSTWVETINFIRSRLPHVIYFPTFLFDFPSRIYVEGDHGEADEYFRKVMDDVLCSLPEPLSLERHILERANKHRGPGAPFSSNLRRTPEGQQIDATVQSLSKQLNRVILGAWNEIFGRNTPGRRIHVEWHVDEDEDHHIYLELSISSGGSRYYLSERSLGFQWFFCFLLFTQFQRSRASRSQIVFLFDEPASHLHSRAQTRLLQSFTKIAEPNHFIVYSTHSHYLINPMWLEKAYVVQNLAINSESDDPFDDLGDDGTNITATKYRVFANANPTKTTYFQPILDALHYQAHETQIKGPAVILEGKYDYFPLKFMAGLSDTYEDLTFYPASGATTMRALVSIFRSADLPFILLLDDDIAGRRALGRYKSALLLDDDEVTTIAVGGTMLQGRSLEAIYGADCRSEICKSFCIRDDEITKQDFHRYFQNLIDTSVKPELDETQANFKLLLCEIQAKLKRQRAFTRSLRV